MVGTGNPLILQGNWEGYQNLLANKHTADCLAYRVEGTESDKHSSLLWYIFNYGNKKYFSTCTQNISKNKNYIVQ